MVELQVRTRLAPIRPAQNPQVESRSKGGGEEESAHVQEESHAYFKTWDVTGSLEATSSSFPISTKPCTCSVI